jgi:hypothetical protein
MRNEAKSAITRLAVSRSEGRGFERGRRYRRHDGTCSRRNAAESDEVSNDDDEETCPTRAIFANFRPTADVEAAAEAVTSVSIGRRSPRVVGVKRPRCQRCGFGFSGCVTDAVRQLRHRARNCADDDGEAIIFLWASRSNFSRRSPATRRRSFPSLEGGGRGGGAMTPAPLSELIEAWGPRTALRVGRE